MSPNILEHMDYFIFHIWNVIFGILFSVSSMSKEARKGGDEIAS